MFYDSAIQKAIDDKRNMAQRETIKLAKVTAIYNGKARVTFYGETTQSGKEFAYLKSYVPALNDKVALAMQGDTYIILGAFTLDAPSQQQQFALANHNHDSVYAAISHSHSGYALTNHSHSGYALTNHSHSGYAATSHNHATVGDQNCTLTFSTYNYSYGIITPKYNNQCALGQSDSRFQYGYFNEIDASTIYPLGSSSSIGGSSSQYWFTKIYGKQIYQNGSAVSTSDRRKKKFISNIADKYLSFFRKLRPVTYKMKDGESGRTHTGFIAQEVEESMKDSGITNMEFAGLVIQENGVYGLRYEEFIALQTKVIQNLMDKVENLENRVAALERTQK